MRVPAAAIRQKPRTSRLKSFPAPVGGWVSNQNLAQPGMTINGQRAPQGAAMLDNFFPTATGAIQRRGSELYVTHGGGTNDTTALFTYLNGAVEKFFGATKDTISDITLSASPTAKVTDLTGGDWIDAQFATSGGTFLSLVNGKDYMLVYDGTDFYTMNGEGVNALKYDGQTANFTAGDTLTGGTSGATATIIKDTDGGTSGTLWVGDVTGGPFQDNETITDGSGGSAKVNGTISPIVGAVTGLDTSKLLYVWPFKNRLFFIEKDSLNAWYMAVDQVTGALSKFPMGGVFDLGGSLLFGANWSIDAGDGLKNVCAFVTTEGQVAVYDGDDPSSADSWQKVGVYRIGRPLGKLGHIRSGGDLVITTSVGFVPISKAISLDYAALAFSSISFPIEVAWNKAVEARSGDWTCAIWPAKQMVLVALPSAAGQPACMFAANARTGAWARFTGWEGTCLRLFKERMFFGGKAGKVIEANVGGQDQGNPYTATYVPLFDDLKAPASIKITKLAQAVFRTQHDLGETVSMQVDFDIALPSPPSAPIVKSDSDWGSLVWGEGMWGTVADKYVWQRWHKTGGRGYTIAPAIQLTSGTTSSLDAEIIRVDVTYELGDLVS